MRAILALTSVLLLTGLSSAQVSVASGYAGYNQPSCGYNQPFVPLVNTPSAPPESAYATPESAYLAVPSPQLSAEAYSNSYAEPSQTDIVARGDEGVNGHFNFGAASVESGYSVAQLAAMAPKPGPSTHVYTNQDIEALHPADYQPSATKRTDQTK